MQGFADALPALKMAVPNASNYSLPKLYESQLGKSFVAHNAETNVRALRQLCHHMKADFLSTSLTSASVVDAVVYERGKAARLPTLLLLVESRGLSWAIVEKAAANGLCYGHVTIAHCRDPGKGLSLATIGSCGK